MWREVVPIRLVDEIEVRERHDEPLYNDEVRIQGLDGCRWTNARAVGVMGLSISGGVKVGAREGQAGRSECLLQVMRLRRRSENGSDVTISQSRFTHMSIEYISDKSTGS